jgi:hypothetical protein
LHTTQNVLVGDVFSGILESQNINVAGEATHWSSTATDTFNGYFAQEVSSIILSEGGNAYEHLNMTTATVDPWGILTGIPGAMLALWVGSSPYETNGSIFDDITKVTNGVMWGALGAGATGDDLDGYAYSHVDMDLNFGNFNDQETNFALDFVQTGAAFNLNLATLEKINDYSENELGGIATSPVTGTCTQLTPTPVTCTDVVGNAELQGNSNSILAGGGSPWFYLSNDPWEIYVPEPGMIALFGIGLLGLGFSAKRGTKKA